MNKRNYTSLSSLWRTLCLLACCGFLSITSLLAQQPKGWEIALAPPGIEVPDNVTANGFTATWTNVDAQQLNDDGTPWNKIFFRLITTREIEAKADGAYNILDSKIKPNPTGKRELVSEQQAHLDAQLSQPDWSAALVYWTPDGFSINAKELESYGIPEDMIGVNARLTSPVIDLFNGDRTYTLEFTVKVLQAAGDVKMKVMGYGEEYSYLSGVPGVKDITVKNDGKPHKYRFKFDRGTWCHRIVIEINDYAEVEFSNDIVVKQDLKKGDRAYRSTSYFMIPYDQAKCDREDLADLSTPERFAAKYSFDVTGLGSGVLDAAKAKADGERIAYRMLYADDRPGQQNSQRLRKSMYSAPAYLDDVEDSNNYLYVGYCNYEAPNYNAIEPTGVSWAGYHGGAIKLTKEKLKDYVGSKVVGIRFASAACLQKDQINNDPGFFTPKLPCIFLAKTVLTQDRSDVNNPKVLTKWDPIQITTVDMLKDGWNTLFFDEPYEITAESEFFAGAYAYDPAAAGGILVRSYQTPGVDPNSAWVSSNWGEYDIEKVRFDGVVNEAEGPLLMQIVIEPKELGPTTLNRGVINKLHAPAYVYSNEEIKPTIEIFNSGVKAISTIKVETDLAGHKQTHVIKLPKSLEASLSRVVELQPIDHEGIFGRTELKVTLQEVNEVVLEAPSVLTANLEILKRDEAYARTTLVEVFTSEGCPNCPAGDQRMENLINKPENAEIKDRFAIVSHHAFNVPDFMMIPYSQGLGAFAGVLNSGGRITLASAGSPTNMFDRKPQAGMMGARGSNGIIYSMISSQKELDLISEASKSDPAYVRLEVKPWFKKESNLLKVTVQGRASTRLDRSRPVYLTIMMTQDRIKPRNQVGKKPEGFMHTNVLRYVDEGGFKGSEITFDDKGDFQIVKHISINTTNSTTGALPVNQFLLEEDNKSIEDVMKEVNVIAFLHYYEELPTNDDVEENDPRLLKNEVLNAAQRRVSFTNFDSVEEVTSQDVQVTIEEGAVRVNVPVAELQVYDMTGRLVPATGLTAGAYVVRLELQDGSEIFTKVVAK